MTTKLELGRQKWLFSIHKPGIISFSPTLTPKLGQWHSSCNRSITAVTLPPRGFEAFHLTNLSFPPLTLATCTSTITSVFAMFKWGRNKKSSFYEPKTPKLTSISLPDEHHVPVHIYHSYSEKQRTQQSYLRDFTPNKRASTPLVQPTTYHRDVPSVRSRPRTMSTPVRQVEGMPYATRLSIQSEGFDKLKPRGRFGRIPHKDRFCQFWITELIIRTSLSPPSEVCLSLVINSHRVSIAVQSLLQHFLKNSCADKPQKHGRLPLPTR